MSTAHPVDVRGRGGKYGKEVRDTPSEEKPPGAGPTYKINGGMPLPPRQLEPAHTVRFPKGEKQGPLRWSYGGPIQPRMKGRRRPVR